MDIGSALHVRSKLYWDAKKLLKALKSSQKSANSGPISTSLDRRKTPTLTGCKKLIARKYYAKAEDAFEALDNIEKFAANNYSSTVWSRKFDRRWRESPYLKQVAALEEAKISGRRLKECADELGINFDGFHFSAFLHRELFAIEPAEKDFRPLPLIDFTGVFANGAYIESMWLGVISSFAEASLKHSKFYTQNPELCRPGTNAHRVDFSGANLSHADMRFSYLRECNFSKALLHGTDLRDSNLFQCQFDGATGMYKAPFKQRKGVAYFNYLAKFHGYQPLKK